MSQIYPKVSIEFCTKCKWQLRSSWYLQELLQTFQTQIREISLIPSLTSGTFKVTVYKSADHYKEIWDRVSNDGFPDSKILKQLVRDFLFPGEEMGHLDKANKNGGVLRTDTGHARKHAGAEAAESEKECVECNNPGI